jgi:hypothetical protein
MATRKKPGETIDVDDVFPPSQATQLRSVSVPEPLPDPVEYDDVTALNNVLAELGEDDAGGGFVTVFRETIDASGKKPDEYLERFPASEFSLDSLKARWGAGKYKISVYQDGRILTRKVITIAKDPNAAAPVAQAQASADLSPILAAIQASNEKMVAAIMVLAQGQQQKGPSRMEMMQEMAMMKDMFAPAAGSQPPAYNPIELMKMGVDMASKGMGGGGESDNAWVGKVIDQLGPILMPAVAAAVTPKATAPARSATALPAPAPRPETPETQQPEENHVSLLITNYLGMLKNAAKKQADVAEYADSILSMVPASNVADIENLLRPDDWRAKVKQHTTAVEEYPDWFTALRDTLLQFIDEDKAAAQAEVSTNLTPVIESDSVVNHVDDNTGQSTGDTGDAPSIT